MKKQIDLNKYKQLYKDFVNKKETVTLSFIKENGEPFSSCTPFVEHDGKIYVYISEIAEHYQLMEQSESVDALIMADEYDTNKLFDKERARWICYPAIYNDRDNE